VVGVVLAPEGSARCRGIGEPGAVLGTIGRNQDRVIENPRSLVRARPLDGERRAGLASERCDAAAWWIDVEGVSVLASRTPLKGQPTTIPAVREHLCMMCSVHPLWFAVAAVGFVAALRLLRPRDPNR